MVNNFHERGLIRFVLDGPVPQLQIGRSGEAREDARVGVGWLGSFFSVFALCVFVCVLAGWLGGR